MAPRAPETGSPDDVAAVSERPGGDGAGELGGATAEAAAPRPTPSGVLAKGWFWGPILPLLALDLWTKSAVFAFLDERYPLLAPFQREYEVWRGPIHFSLVQYHNPGTVWGLAQDFTEALIALRITALFVLGFVAWRTAATRRLRLLVLGMIVAGAAGNLYDNLTEPEGGVRDFLLFFVEAAGGGRHVFPAFNVADSCITVGAIALAILVWRDDA